MKHRKLTKFSSFALSALLLTFSCQKDEDDRITLKDSQDISEEAVVESYFQDQDDMAGVAMGAPANSDFGRTKAITIDDSRFQCSGVTVTLEKSAGSTAQTPKGVITVDFGSGCTDAKGNVRTGKLIFTYNGLRFQPGSTVVTTSNNYTINGVKVEGTRTLTNESTSTADNPKFKVVLTNGKATFADGSVAERSSTIIWQLVKGVKLSDSYILVDKSSVASGKTRTGRTYSVTLSEDLKYKRSCGGIAIDGIKKYVVDGGKEITIDFGDGECDRAITVTVNGVTKNVVVD